MREHSTGWLETLAKAVQQRRGAEQADQLLIATLAAAAPHSREAADQVQKVVDELTAEADGNEERQSTLDYITDPNAQPDWAALRPFAAQAGMGYQQRSGGEVDDAGPAAGAEGGAQGAGDGQGGGTGAEPGQG